MGKTRKKGKKQPKQTGKEVLNGFFWRLVPFLILLLVLCYVAVLGNGYEIFEERGWNPMLVLVLRYFDHIVLALIPMVIALLLLWFYVRAWIRWIQNKEGTIKKQLAKILIASVLFLGALSVLLSVSINLWSTVFQAPDDYWQREWDLK